MSDLSHLCALSYSGRLSIRRVKETSAGKRLGTPVCVQCDGGVTSRSLRGSLRCRFVNYGFYCDYIMILMS